MSTVQIKICGITNLEDAHVCFERGVEMIGLNFYRRSSRYVAPQQARAIRLAIGRKTELVGVFVHASLDEVRHLARHCDITTVQLHGDYSPEECAELAREFRVIRALPLTAEFRPEDASAFRECDILLDAPYEELHGGGGERCDWNKARATVGHARFSVLAGGLTPSNIEEAICAVNPDAVDICSGVERMPGIKDHTLITQFISAVRDVTVLPGQRL